MSEATKLRKPTVSASVLSVINRTFLRQFVFMPGCHGLMQKAISFNNNSNVSVLEIIIWSIFGVQVRIKP